MSKKKYVGVCYSVKVAYYLNEAGDNYDPKTIHGGGRYASLHEAIEAVVDYDYYIINMHRVYSDGSISNGRKVHLKSVLHETGV